MTVADYWLVEAEFKRIQTYLFAVPRLPVMVGANARLGETLHGLWRGDHFAEEPWSLPALARQCRARWPDQETGERPRGVTQGNDPLIWENVWQDDVEAVARQTGVLTRDAGHFEAVFPDEDKAREFVRQARELVEERLPGVLLEVRLAKLAHDGHIFCQQPPVDLPTPMLDGIAVLDFPQAEVCQYSGQEPASKRIKEPGGDGGEVSVGGSVEERRQHGRDFDQGKTRDILGMLRPVLLRDLGWQRNDDAFPTEFSQLAINGYLAVIHVDGNSVGSRFRAYQDQQTSDDFFAKWCHREAFYHTLRLGVRHAVCRALRETFSGLRTRQGRAPLRLLMLGGDDLVLVCGAPFGLPFVVALARAVRETTRDLPSEEEGKPAPLTLGTGVAIVQDSFPFHRAYELAEDLASSAKRLKSSLPATDGNVVDWIVTSEAWHGDIQATRHDNFVIDGTLILSAKPYSVLKSASGDGTVQSLETMLQDAKDLAEWTREERVARSQLQGLVRSLPRGRHTARFAAEILPRGLREILEKKGYLSRKEGPWVPLPDGRRYRSQVLDLLELYELEILRHEAEQSGALMRDTDRTETDS